MVKYPPEKTEFPTAVKRPQFNVPDIAALPFETLKLPLEAVKADELVKPVHVIACNDVVPDETVKPDELVKPVHVIACKDVVPDVTDKPDKDIKPVHNMLFVESKALVNFSHIRTYCRY